MVARFTRAQLEAICGTVTDAEYNFACQFRNAMEAEVTAMRAARPELTERDCVETFRCWCDGLFEERLID